MWGENYIINLLPVAVVAVAVAALIGLLPPSRLRTALVWLWGLVPIATVGLVALIAGPLGNSLWFVNLTTLASVLTWALLVTLTFNLVRRSREQAGVKRTAYYVLAPAVVASLAGNVFLYREWSRQRAEVPYNQHFHGPVIEEAIKLYSREIGVSPEEAMRNRFPMAMTIPDAESPGGEMRCVSLELRQGMLGFTPVYCFDRDGDRARLKSQAKF